MLSERRQREVGPLSLMRRLFQGDITATTSKKSRFLSRWIQTLHGDAWFGDETVEREDVEIGCTREKFFTIATAKSWDRQPEETAHPPLWALSAELGKALSNLIRSQHQPCHEQEVGPKSLPS